MSKYRRRKFGDVPVVTEEQAQENPDQAQIVIPDSEEGREILERITTHRRCGKCRWFNLKRGQEELRNPKDPFIVRLVREMKLRSLVGQMDWDKVGVCEHWSGSGDKLFLTNAISPARTSKEHAGQALSYYDKDHNVACEAYEERGVDGKEIRSYRSTKNSRTVGTD